MNQRYKWLTILILPLMVSCSSNRAFVKKDPCAKPSFRGVAKAGKSQNSLAHTHHDGVFHIVGSEESLPKICQVYGLDLRKVARINKLKSPYLLKRGDAVFLPSEAIIDEPDPRSTRCAAHPKNKHERHLKKRLKRLRMAKAIRGKRHPKVPELIFPVPGGTLTSPFGYRWGRFHQGLDIAAPVGTPILACARGTVAFTGSRRRFRRYGKTVLVDHGNGVYTYYAHLHRVKCKKGDRLRQGQLIGLVGNTGRSTGPHLHLEVRVDNNLYNPLGHLSRKALSGMRIAKRFSKSPMGPVRARWRVPDLLALHH